MAVHLEPRVLAGEVEDEPSTLLDHLQLTLVHLQRREAGSASDGPDHHGRQDHDRRESDGLGVLDRDSLPDEVGRHDQPDQHGDRQQPTRGPLRRELVDPRHLGRDLVVLGDLPRLDVGLRRCRDSDRGRPDDRARGACASLGRDEVVGRVAGVGPVLVRLRRLGLAPAPRQEGAPGLLPGVLRRLGGLEGPGRLGVRLDRGGHDRLGCDKGSRLGHGRRLRLVLDDHRLRHGFGRRLGLVLRLDGYRYRLDSDALGLDGQLGFGLRDHRRGLDEGTDRGRRCDVLGFEVPAHRLDDRFDDRFHDLGYGLLDGARGSALHSGLGSGIDPGLVTTLGVPGAGHLDRPGDGRLDGLGNGLGNGRLDGFGNGRLVDPRLGVPGDLSLDGGHRGRDGLLEGERDRRRRSGGRGRSRGSGRQWWLGGGDRQRDGAGDGRSERDQRDLGLDLDLGRRRVDQSRLEPLQAATRVGRLRHLLGLRLLGLLADRAHDDRLPARGRLAVQLVAGPGGEALGADRRTPKVDGGAIRDPISGSRSTAEEATAAAGIRRARSRRRRGLRR